jgi:hypothetical protein
LLNLINTTIIIIIQWKNIMWNNIKIKNYEFNAQIKQSKNNTTNNNNDFNFELEQKSQPYLANPLILHSWSQVEQILDP